MLSFTYTQGRELPDLTVEWKDSAGALINFASGWTFVLKVGAPGSAAVLTKSTGITGAATAPNVTVAFATSGELNTITPGNYTADLIATRTSDSKERALRFSLTVDSPIT